MFYNNKFATKNDPQRQLTKKWPKRHFAEEVNRNENLQDMIKSHNLQTRCCQDQQGVAEMMSSLTEIFFENLKKKKSKKKVVWKDNLQNSYQKRPPCVEKKVNKIQGQSIFKHANFYADLGRSL